MVKDNKTGWGGGLTSLQALLDHAVVGWDGLFTDNISFQQKRSPLETPRKGISCSQNDWPLRSPHCPLSPPSELFAYAQSVDTESAILRGVIPDRGLVEWCEVSTCHLSSTALGGSLCFSAPCGSLVQLSLFCLLAESEMPWVFSQRAAITYTWLLSVLWLFAVNECVHGVTLVVQQDGVQKPRVF